MNRLDLVNKSIMETGSYTQTVSELSFGSQLAWRNAPRCIGRIQWSNLQVRIMCTCTNVESMML